MLTVEHFSIKDGTECFNLDTPGYYGTWGHGNAGSGNTANTLWLRYLSVFFAGMKARAVRFNNKTMVELSGSLNFGINRSNKLLIPGVNTTITLELNRPQWCLNSKKEKSMEYKIEDCRLYADRYLLDQRYSSAIAQQLDSGTLVQYSFPRTVVNLLQQSINVDKVNVNLPFGKDSFM